MKARDEFYKHIDDNFDDFSIEFIRLYVDTIHEEVAKAEERLKEEEKTDRIIECLIDKNFNRINCTHLN